MKRSRIKQQAGISLIEMLVAFMIVILLAAIITPSVARMKTRALLTECMSNQRNIGVAMHQYASDNNGKLPPFIQGGERLSSTGHQNTLAANLVPPKGSYLPNPDMFLDPGALGRIYKRNTAGWADWNSGSKNRSGYWHIYMSPTSELYSERADDSQYGANDRTSCAPNKVVLHCYFHPTLLEECAHPDGSVNVLRVDGSVQQYSRNEYNPSKSVLVNFGHVK